MNSNTPGLELAICHYYSLNTVERNQIKKSLKKINPEIKMKIIKNKSSPILWGDREGSSQFFPRHNARVWTQALAGLQLRKQLGSSQPCGLTSVASQLVSTPVESTHRGLPKGLDLKTNYLKNYFKGYTCTFYSNSYQILNKSFISFIKRQPSLLLLELVVPGKDVSPLYSNSKTFSINHLDAQKLSEKEILYTQLLKQKQLPIIQSLYFMSKAPGVS